jgi:hypothetical protein
MEESLHHEAVIEQVTTPPRMLEDFREVCEPPTGRIRLWVCRPCNFRQAKRIAVN